MASPRKTKTASPAPATTVRVAQEEIPGAPLGDALRIPSAIANSYGGRPSSPLHVASAAGISPTSSTFRTICGAAIAYGLTTGGYNAAQIALTDLGRRITKPTEEGAAASALVEALLKPRVEREFLLRYDGSKFPPANIAANVLETLGVPAERSGKAFSIISENARLAGVLREIKGSTYVDIKGLPPEGVATTPIDSTDEFRSIVELSTGRDEVLSSIPTYEQQSQNRRVFVTHGKNRSLLDFLKKLLQLGELEAIISAERESVSVPVPDKVMNDMRSCAAAVIHVDDEQTLTDQSGDSVVVLNPNVLIEIGAAMALYGRRFILLVKEGTKLPSNLQGLYEVRYKGDSLDGETTVRVLSAIYDMKNHKLPTVRGPTQE